jgi:hypothetical protein
VIATSPRQSAATLQPSVRQGGVLPLGNRWPFIDALIIQRLIHYDHGRCELSFDYASAGSFIETQKSGPKRKIRSSFNVNRPHRVSRTSNGFGGIDFGFGNPNGIESFSPGM